MTRIEIETRYQRVAREQAERRAKREIAREIARKVASRPRHNRLAADHRIADRIDGYDRDDLGLSPDY